MIGAEGINHGGGLLPVLLSSLGTPHEPAESSTTFKLPRCDQTTIPSFIGKAPLGPFILRIGHPAVTNERINPCAATACERFAMPTIDFLERDFWPVWLDTVFKSSKTGGVVCFA